VSTVRKPDVCEPSSGNPMTADERANLISEGFDVDDEYPEYGQRALLKAYRAGFLDGIDSANS
jgi:hypothetical protein